MATSTEPANPPSVTTSQRAPPARAVSLDPAALSDGGTGSSPPGSGSGPLQPLLSPTIEGRNAPVHTRPLHSLSRSKGRSYTSPHLTALASSGTLPPPPADRRHLPGTHGRRQASGSSLAAEVAATIEPEAVTPVDVFLGGSCNPTTWRRDVAIPLLEAARIKYFNPQVDEWYEALVAAETRAKEGAKIIFMVIDDLARSIVSINEAVEYISRHRRLVLVVQNIQLGTAVDGVPLTPGEIADLNGARECLRRIAARHDVRLYDNVAIAIEETISWLVEENPRAYAPEMPRLRKRSSIILNEWAGQFRPRRNTSRSWSSTSLLSVVSSGDDLDDDGHDPALSTSPDRERSLVKHLGSSTSRSRGGFVYLGGNLQATSWREQVAIPRLQQAGIAFYIPYQDYLSCELQRLTNKQPPVSRGDRWLEMEMERDAAELVLFVIPGRSRSIAAMVEAVELICNDHALLLVLEPLVEGCVLDDGCQVVGREYKDLARARVYLQEMAERHDVEVFQSVHTAVDGLLARLR